MNKEEYLSKMKEVDDKLGKLGLERQKLKKAYLEANQPFDVGCKVIAELFDGTKEILFIVGYAVSNSGTITPHFVKTKKDGTKSQIRFNDYYVNSFNKYEQTTKDS